MPRYRFFRAADKAQDSIWSYTHKEHGPAHAIRYMEGLHKHLAALAAQKKPWHPLPAHLQIRPAAGTLYLSKYKAHFIFFRELPGGDIGILSLLHEKMDMPTQLTADLHAQEEKSER